MCKINPLVPFDYVYYSIAYFYENNGYKKQKEFVGIMFLSLLQFFNGLTIFDLTYKPLREINIFNPTYVFVIGYAIILFLNLIRYKEFILYEKLLLKWENEIEKIKNVKGGLVVLYICLTFLLLIVK